VGSAMIRSMSIISATVRPKLSHMRSAIASRSAPVLCGIATDKLARARALRLVAAPNVRPIMEPQEETRSTDRRLGSQCVIERAAYEKLTIWTRTWALQAGKSLNQRHHKGQGCS